MSEPIERREPPTPRRSASAAGRNTGTPDNPWLTLTAVAGVFALLAGVIAYTAGYNSATDTTLFGDSDPAAGIAAMFAGEMLLIFGAFLVTGWLVASAICWQLGRRES